MQTLLLSSCRHCHWVLLSSVAWPACTFLGHQAADQPPLPCCVAACLQIGGAAAVKAAVDIFYVKVLADPLLKRFFDGVGMVKQKQHQARFLTKVFGGPDVYTGRTLAAAHKQMIIEKGLGLDHFDAVAGELGVSEHW